MSSMHVQNDLEDRMIALGYKKRMQRVTFVNEATRERLEREEEAEVIEREKAQKDKKVEE